METHQSVPAITSECHISSEALTNQEGHEFEK